MADLWVVAISEDDFDWLQDQDWPKLRPALAAWLTIWTEESGGLAPMMVYTDEWMWLTSKVLENADWRNGLAFALNTATPANHSMRSYREWADSRVKLGL